MRIARLLAAWTIVALLSLSASYVTGLSYWWAISTVVVAMLLNSIIAEFEDRLRGGFLDPAKKGR
jgi:uncharacterized membrane protein YhdT